MKKINRLFEFLVSRKLYEEADALFKVANKVSPEKHLEDNYRYKVDSSGDKVETDIYKAFLAGNKPAGAWISIINRLKHQKGFSNSDILNLSINNFSEMIDIFKKDKASEEEKFYESVLIWIRKYNKDITDEDLKSMNLPEKVKSAKEFGINPIEIGFLIGKDNSNHSWNEKIDMVRRFNQEGPNNPQLRADKVNRYRNLDEAMSDLDSHIKYESTYLRDFYNSIKEKALDNTGLIYNSNKYTITHSKSKEAAQYWEQSCVTFDKETGNINSGLCTASIKASYFDEYSSERPENFAAIVQIITKENTTSVATPKTGFSKENYGWNLLSIQLVRPKRVRIYPHQLPDRVKDPDAENVLEFQPGFGASVNRYNKNIKKCDIRLVLGDEYEAAIDKIEEYFRDNYNVPRINNLKCEKNEILEVDSIRSEAANTSAHILFFEKLMGNAKNISIENDLKNYILLLPPKYFFENKIDEKINDNEIIDSKLKKLHFTEYFKLKLDEKYAQNEIILRKNLESLSPQMFFGLNTKMRNFDNRQSKMEMQKYDEKYPQFKDIVQKHLEWIDSALYFKFKLDEKYSKYQHILLYHIPGFFKSHIRGWGATPEAKRRLSEKYGDISNIDMLIDMTPRMYFKYRLDEKPLTRESLINANKEAEKEGDYLFRQTKKWSSVIKPKEQSEKSKKLWEKIMSIYETDSDLLIKIKDLDKVVLHNKLYEIDGLNLFHMKLDEKHDIPRDILEVKLGDFEPSEYYRLGLDQKYKDEFPKIENEYISNINGREYFKNKLYLKYPNLINQKIKGLSPETLLWHNPEDLFREKDEVIKFLDDNVRRLFSNKKIKREILFAELQLEDRLRELLDFQQKEESHEQSESEEYSHNLSGEFENILEKRNSKSKIFGEAKLTPYYMRSGLDKEDIQSILEKINILKQAESRGYDEILTSAAYALPHLILCIVSSLYGATICGDSFFTRNDIFKKYLSIADKRTLELYLKTSDVELNNTLDPKDVLSIIRPFYENRFSKDGIALDLDRLQSGNQDIIDNIIGVSKEKEEDIDIDLDYDEKLEYNIKNILNRKDISEEEKSRLISNIGEDSFELKDEELIGEDIDKVYEEEKGLHEILPPYSKENKYDISKNSANRRRNIKKLYKKLLIAKIKAKK